MSADEMPISDNEDEEIELELDPRVGLVEKTAEDPARLLRRCHSRPLGPEA